MAQGDIRLEDHWPLIVVTFEGSASKASFERYLAQMEVYLSRGERHGYLLDAREGAMLGAEERTAQAAWLKRHKQALVQYSIGSALVIRSAAARFIVAAIYLLQAPVAPTESFGTIDEAHAWLNQLFTKEGLRVPPRSKLPR